MADYDTPRQKLLVLPTLSLLPESEQREVHQDSTVHINDRHAARRVMTLTFVVQLAAALWPSPLDDPSALSGALPPDDGPRDSGRGELWAAATVVPAGVNSRASGRNANIDPDIGRGKKWTSVRTSSGVTTERTRHDQQLQTCADTKAIPPRVPSAASTLPKPPGRSNTVQ